MVSLPNWDGIEPLKLLTLRSLPPAEACAEGARCWCLVCGGAHIVSESSVRLPNSGGIVPLRRLLLRSSTLLWKLFSPSKPSWDGREPVRLLTLRSLRDDNKR